MMGCNSIIKMYCEKFFCSFLRTSNYNTVPTHDSVKKINYLISHPLSPFWKHDRESRVKMGFFPVIYVAGMVGYSLALPSRVLSAVWNFLCLIGMTLKAVFSTNRNHFHHMKDEAIIFTGSCAELISGMVGCVCPPLAYFLDEMIHSHETIQRQAWFQWSDDVPNV